MFTSIENKISKDEEDDKPKYEKGDVFFKRTIRKSKVITKAEDAPIFIATNNLLNKLNYDGKYDLSKLLGDDLVEIILDELKSNM